jgi:perosamine synthetase
VAQLGKADKFWRRRREIAARYQQGFSTFEELELPPGDSSILEHSWHLFILRLRPDCLSINRDEFIAELKALGIGTSVHFIPLHRHPYYVRQYGCKTTDFPGAEDAFSRCISLPIYPDMSDEQADRVIGAVTKIVCRSRKFVSV